MLKSVMCEVRCTRGMTWKGGGGIAYRSHVAIFIWEKAKGKRKDFRSAICDGTYGRHVALLHNIRSINCVASLFAISILDYLSLT